MKTIFLSLLIISGMAQAQTGNSQTSQAITLRLQPVSLFDFSTVTTGKPLKQTADRNDPAASASVRDIIVNKNLSADAVVPSITTALQNEEKNSYPNLIAYNNNRMQPVYTFSNR